MDTIRRVRSVVNKGGRRVWKSIKKNCLQLCFKICRRRKSPKPTECTVEISDGVTDETVKSNRAKRCKNTKSQEPIQTLQEGYEKKIVENDEIKSLDQPPRNSLEETAESSAPSSPRQCVRNNTENFKVNRILKKNYNNYATRQRGRPYISVYFDKQGKRIVRMDLAHHEIELDKAEKAWVPAIATTKTTRTVEYNETEELSKTVKSILNKITPENIDVMIKDFVVLPINTIERLENVVDLVFEKAIEEPCFASHYAVLCSALQSVQVTCVESNRTTKSFKTLLVKKCQSLFESNNQTKLKKKSENIESCTDPEKRKELQIEFEEAERSLRRRSIGNCCFIGELFNKKIININMMQFCITNSLSKRTEESLECLCNLLKVAGKKLEQSCDLNSTISKIVDLTTVKSISMRTRFMMRDVLDMRNNKWAPKILDDKSEVTDQKENISNCDKQTRPADVVVKVTETDGRGQMQKPTCSKTSRTSKGKTDGAVKDEMDPAELNDKIRRLCSGAIREYEQLHNLDDVIYLLVEDKTSVLRTRHQDFVTSTTLMTLDDKPNTRTEAGKMFAELLSKNVLNMTDITRGIDAVLKEWDDYLMDYPHFFSYVAAIVAPLLTAKTASFGFCNLKQACSSIRPNNSSAFFAEIMHTILRSENAVNVHNDSAREFSGVLRTYDMWRGQAKHVPLDVFMPDNQINKFFKNDQLGVLLLAMSMHKTTQIIQGNKSLYSTIHKWIKKNVDADTVRVADFVRSLTVATAIVCSNNDDPNVDFFDRDRSKLIKNYVLSECDFTKDEIQEREYQCIRGSQEISATFQERHKSGDMEFWKSRLLGELCRVGAISTDTLKSS